MIDIANFQSVTLKEGVSKQAIIYNRKNEMCKI